MADAQVATIPSAKTSVLVRMADRFGVDAAKLHSTLKATAFKGDVSNEQFMALMIVADQYGLNPLTKELYAFPDKNNGIVPVVGLDGWARIVNEHPQYDGLEFVDGPADKNGIPDWIECVIYRKDREHPTKVREFYSECKRATGPWGSHPRRMLRHKALIQCARLAFGFVGIYDQDEAERIIEGAATLVPEGSGEAISKINADITGGTVIDAEPETQQGTAKPKQPAPAQPEPEPVNAAASFAEVAAAINAAADLDALDLAADLIRQVGDERQRAELDVELRAKRKGLTK